MKTTAWIIYNKLHKPEDWQFFSTKKACEAEYNRVYTGSIKEVAELSGVKPVKITIEYERPTS